MAINREDVLKCLSKITLPDGGTLTDRDMIRALTITDDRVSFIIELPSDAHLQHAGPLKDMAEQAVNVLQGVATTKVALSAPPKAAQGQQDQNAAPPSLKIGRHPDGQTGQASIPGVDRIVAIASGKGGVGKSTVTSNLAVALAKEGRKVGLLDADIYGPSQPMMFGVSGRPSSPDGKKIIPFKAHGVTLMSIGFMVEAGKAVVWRGPMLMGALQQMLGQVEWGELDVLLVDLPPGTGDVQLTLSQRSAVTGAIIVSTPQDVALIDARKAIDMFNTLKTPVLGMIENMAVFQCPNCGHEAHIFGDGGVAREADALGLPLLARLPIDLDTRLGGDGGNPVSLGEGEVAQAYRDLAKGLIAGGMS